MHVTLRLASHADIPAALQLCRISGWNQRAVDWVRLLDYEPEGCFAAESDGQLVGTVTTTCYGTDMAWIGMMLVHPDYRRRGIATQLMNRSLCYLRDRGVRCIKLDATPEGSFVYRQLGFAEEWSMRRWMREGTGTQHPRSLVQDAAPDTSRPDVSGADVSGIDASESPRPVPSKRPTEASTASQWDASILTPYLHWDHRAFGVDRRRWLELLLPDSTIRLRGGAIGMLRPGFLASYLGPLIVAGLDEGGAGLDEGGAGLDEGGAGLDDARCVVDDLLRSTRESVFWDIPDPNDVAVSLAQELGFRPVRELTRMWTGSRLIQSDLQSLFALADPSTG